MGDKLTPLHADTPDSIFEPLRFKMLDVYNTVLNFKSKA